MADQIFCHTAKENKAAVVLFFALILLHDP